MKFASALVLLLGVSACTGVGTPATGPHATVQLRDGSAVTGMVLSSTADEVKITTDDNVTRTIPMAQVRAIDYGDQAASAPAAPGAAPTMAKSVSRPAPAPVLPRPTADDITTDTHTVPSGTEISVRTEETIDGSTAADGQVFVADVTDSVRDAENKVVIPAGAKARLIIKKFKTVQT